MSDWPPIRALSIVARAESPTRAATSTRFVATTILHPITKLESISIKDSSASTELFVRDNCEPRSKNREIASERSEFSPFRHKADTTARAEIKCDGDPNTRFRASEYHCC